ncbi:LysR family transcriptional regulator [Rhodococcus sp. APC 3903]|uniref:LysR family transcriptional regulator n=1 Tax=Rhodococcus sp. APC 3903 TaxID=3035193 RepID=UPI0025B528B0|nr:LysR family transcriptional regulator [Rhodococcus sp. APC 3903]MDN3461014.1 LysR family transcriptional regulator [Rhodococcus sp. APC 3903]
MRKVTNVANLDLNLLVSLDALLQHRSVTKAAQQLGLSQPALSASLARLRRHYNDELLYRAGNQSHLTPLAAELRKRTRLALDGVERAFSAQPEFSPDEATREFAILISDYGITVLGDTIAGLLAEVAPQARLRFRPTSPDLVARAEQTLVGADLMLVPHGFVTDLPHADLYRDRWVVVVSTDNDTIGEVLTVDDLRTSPWVVVFHGQTAATPADRQLRMLGIEPRVQVITENFLTVPNLVVGSTRIALLQERLVHLLPLNSGLRTLQCPVDVGELVEAMWWHPVYERDPEHIFLRDIVSRAAQLATDEPRTER